MKKWSRNYSGKNLAEVVEVNSISDRTIWMRLQLNGEIANILCVCPSNRVYRTKKDEFWELLDEAVGKIVHEGVDW